VLEAAAFQAGGAAATPMVQSEGRCDLAYYRPHCCGRPATRRGTRPAGRCGRGIGPGGRGLCARRRGCFNRTPLDRGCQGCSRSCRVRPGCEESEAGYTVISAKSTSNKAPCGRPGETGVSARVVSAAVWLCGVRFSLKTVNLPNLPAFYPTNQPTNQPMCLGFSFRMSLATPNFIFRVESTQLLLV
jgi:hypothetical protein